MINGNQMQLRIGDQVLVIFITKRYLAYILQRQQKLITFTYFTILTFTKLRSQQIGQALVSKNKVM